MFADDPLHPRILLESASASIEINSTAAAALLQLPRLVPQLPTRGAVVHLRFAQVVRKEAALLALRGVLWGGLAKLPRRLGVHITAGDTPITDEAVLVNGKLPRNVLYIVGLNMAAERCRFCYSFPLGPFPHIRGYGENNQVHGVFEPPDEAAKAERVAMLRAAASSERPHLLLVPRVGDVGRRGSRLQVLESFEAAPYMFKRTSPRYSWVSWRVSSRKLPTAEYLRLMGESSFVLSPDGSAPDCFRHWEAMLAGAVPVVQDSAVVRVLRRNHPGLPFLVLAPRESDGRYDPPSDPAWWRAQLAELAPVLNASAAEEKTSVLDAAYWRRFLGELNALV